MSVDTEFFSRGYQNGSSKVFVTGQVQLRWQQTRESTSKGTFRDFVFGKALPVFFVTLVYYHFFIYSPDTPRFYSNLLHHCLAG